MGFMDKLKVGRGGDAQKSQFTLQPQNTNVRAEDPTDAFRPADTRSSSSKLSDKLSRSLSSAKNMASRSGKGIRITAGEGVDRISYAFTKSGSKSSKKEYEAFTF